MGVRGSIRAALGAATALTIGAVSASAQVVTYSTTGTFAGASCAGGTSCTVDGFTLSFVNALSTSYMAPTLVDLGQFSTAATGGTQPPAAFAGITFTLTVNQTQPSAGSGAFTGSVSGSLSYNPSSSSLVWTPTTNALSIGFATYRLVTDNTGNINIQAPTTGTDGNPNLTSVKANVNVTPEPATFLLLAPGLAGLGLAARARSRKSSK